MVDIYIQCFIYIYIILYIIHKLKYSLTIKSLKLIYNTFFLPHLNYCNTVYSIT